MTDDTPPIAEVPWIDCTRNTRLRASAITAIAVVIASTAPVDSRYQIKFTADASSYFYNEMFRDEQDAWDRVAVLQEQIGA